jgi:hypothetical protein
MSRVARSRSHRSLRPLGAATDQRERATNAVNAPSGDASESANDQSGWIAVYVRPSALPLLAPRPTLITQHNCLQQLGVPPERFKRDARRGKFPSCLRGKLRTATHDDAARYYGHRHGSRPHASSGSARSGQPISSPAEKKADQIRRELRLIRIKRSRSHG